MELSMNLLEYLWSFTDIQVIKLLTKENIMIPKRNINTVDHK